MPRIEDQVHEQVWAAANATLTLERAIDEARSFCYAVLDRVPDDGEQPGETLRYEASRWLDNYGRSPFREARQAEQTGAE